VIKLAMSGYTIFMLCLLFGVAFIGVIVWTIRTKMFLNEISKKVFVHVFHVGNKFWEHRTFNCIKRKAVIETQNYSLELVGVDFLGRKISPRTYPYYEKYMIKNGFGKNEIFFIEIGGTLIPFLPMAKTFALKDADKMFSMKKNWGEKDEDFNVRLEEELKTYKDNLVKGEVVSVSEVMNSKELFDFKNVKDEAAIELKHDYYKYAYVPKDKGVGMGFIIIAGIIIIAIVLIFTVVGSKKKAG